MFGVPGWRVEGVGFKIGGFRVQGWRVSGLGFKVGGFGVWGLRSEALGFRGLGSWVPLLLLPKLPSPPAWIPL